MSEINAALSGGNALSGYYRGSAAVPASKTVWNTVTEGPYYSESTPWSCWIWSSSGTCDLYWFNDSRFASGIGSGSTSFSSGGYTYYRGVQVRSKPNTLNTRTTYYHQIYRTYSTSSTATINSNVPSSGSIAFSNLYGVERP